MVLGAVVAIDAGAVIGLDQLQPVFVEILQRQVVPVDVIEKSRTPRPSVPLPAFIRAL